MSLFRYFFLGIVILLTISSCKVRCACSCACAEDTQQESSPAVSETNAIADASEAELPDDLQEVTDSVKVEAIERAKSHFVHDYRSLGLMNCSLGWVRSLESSYHELLHLGIPENEIEALCHGENCREKIRYYKLFFSELDHGTLDSFKRSFDFQGFQSPVIRKYFSPEQLKFIQKLISSTSEFKRYQALYKGEGGIDRQTSFRALNDL